jgi:hypothetical protein
MNKLNFEDFVVKSYSKSIYKILITAIENKKLKEFLLAKEYHHQKELKLMMKNLSDKVALDFVEILKSKGFPDNEIPQDEQQLILREVINAHTQTKK